MRIKKEIVVETIKNFNGLKHRIEFVGCINGVKYINDSKATNPDSTCLALECFDNVILLLGGVDKGLNYNDIFKFQNIKYIICFGQAKEIIYKSAIDFGLTNICKCNNMADALHYAQKIAFENDIVLLSPACSSFDEFNSYEHRGDKFIELVKNDLGGL